MGLFTKMFSAFGPITEPEPQAAPLEERALFNEASYNQSMYLSNSTYGGHLTPQEAMSIAAFDRGVNILADLVSNMPLQHYKDRKKLPNVTILERPYPLETRKDTLFAWAVDYLLYGNAFGILTDYDPLMYPRTIIPVHPRDVTIQIAQGIPFYKINNVTYTRDQIFHVRGFRNSGELVGHGVLERAYNTVQHALVQNRRSHNILENGSINLAITVPEQMEPQEKSEMRENWGLYHNSRNVLPAILDMGAEIKEYGYNSSEQQLIEARHFSIVEIANHLGIPSYFLNYVDGNSYTYTNGNDKGLELVKYSIAAITSRFEEEFTTLLPRGRYARFNFDSFLRADIETRARVYSMGLRDGWMVVEEVRDLEDLGELPDQPEPEIEDQDQEPKPDTTVRFLRNEEGEIIGAERITNNKENVNK